MTTIIKKGKLPVWYKRWEIWGGILLAVFSAASVIMMMFPEIEIMYRMGAMTGVLISLVKTIYGVIKGYKSNNLNGSITVLMDRLPDNFTGKKGKLLE